MKPNVNEKLLDCFSKMQVDIALIKQQNDNQSTKLDELCEKVKQQNGRVGKLEMWQNYVVGIGTTVVGVFSYQFSRK